MPLTTQEILKLLDGKQMTKGRAGAMLRRSEKPGNYLTADQRAFLQSVYKTPYRKSDVSVPHPQDEATRAQYRRDKDEDLTAVELAWLQRLPLDPAKVTFDDATHLAALANSVKVTKTPASARLVQSVWQPVKQLHDERIAKARVEHVRAGLNDLPDTTIGAIADALAEQHPGVSRDALMHDARDIVKDFEGKRDRDHHRAVERADQQLAQVDEDIRRSTETARESAA
jgi:hypothetical protein